MLVAGILVGGMIVLCLPASRLVAAIVEKKSSTYTIAGAAFVAAMLLPPVVWLGAKYLAAWGLTLYAVPTLAAAAIAYALAEAIGRLACMSFGCCYGMPLRDASPGLAKVFRHFNTVFHGETKKAAYASGLQEEPLIPVQALTSVVFTLSGLIGLVFFVCPVLAAGRAGPDCGHLGMARDRREPARRSSGTHAHLGVSGHEPHRIGLSLSRGLPDAGERSGT